MIAQIIIQRIKKRVKLRRMEKAIGIKLTKKQRMVVLAPCTAYWGRRSGKTICACFWILLNRENPITFVSRSDPFTMRRDERRIFSNWIPDPDNWKTQSAELHTYRLLMEFKNACDQNNIKTCGVVPFQRRPTYFEAHIETARSSASRGKVGEGSALPQEAKPCE